MAWHMGLQPATYDERLRSRADRQPRIRVDYQRQWDAFQGHCRTPRDTTGLPDRKEPHPPLQSPQPNPARAFGESPGADPWASAPRSTSRRSTKPRSTMTATGCGPAASASTTSPTAVSTSCPGTSTRPSASTGRWARPARRFWRRHAGGCHVRSVRTRPVIVFRSLLPSCSLLTSAFPKTPLPRD